MANRYLIGSGAFTSTSIWSTTYNGTGGASVPVSGDIIYVDANYNITSALPTSGSFDFIVRLGANTASGVTLGLSGSPTFRLLDIRSANSAAHTVNFDSDVAINVNKFIAIGSSSSNKLTLAGNNDGLAGTQIVLQSGGTSYGQFVHASGVRGNTFSGVPKYLGSNSTQTTGAFGTMQWLLQDPPAISTLVDPLTVAPASNSNWVKDTSFGTTWPSTATTGSGGGGYRFSATTSTRMGIYTAGTYDFVDSDLVYQVIPVSASTYGVNLTLFVDKILSSIRVLSNGSASDDKVTAYAKPYGGTEASLGTTTGLTFSGFIKIRVQSSDSKVHVYYSATGSSFTEFGTGSTITSGTLEYFRSARINISNDYGNMFVSPNLYDIGSINPTLSVENTKTQTATARIRVPYGIGAFGYGFNEQPFNGIQDYASPAVELTRAQTAIAKIASSVSATQSATAYLIQSGSFTQSATARVANTVSVTQATKASISNTRSATQSAIAKIVKTFTATQPAVAKISVQATITQTAIAKIARTLSAAQGATARVLVSFQATNTQTSVARIANTYTRTQTAFARIAATATSTQTAKSAIANTETATQTATAVIVISREIEQTATAAISVQPAVTQSATARIGILYDNPTDGDGDRKYDEFGIPTGEVNAVIPDSGDRIYDVGVIDEGEYTSRSINEDNIYTVD